MSSCRLGFYREVNVNGIAEERFRITNESHYCDSYSSDGVLLKGVELCIHQDTISKRCLTNQDVIFIKKYLKNHLYKVKRFSLEPYSYRKDLRQCVGLFELHYDKPPYKYPCTYMIPIIKLSDTLIINCENDISETLENYLKDQLSNYYDTIDLENRIEAFRHGNRLVYTMSHTPARFYGSSK